MDDNKFHLRIIEREVVGNTPFTFMRKIYLLSALPMLSHYRRGGIRRNERSNEPPKTRVESLSWLASRSLVIGVLFIDKVGPKIQSRAATGGI
jgi:hypothetical protein